VRIFFTNNNKGYHPYYLKPIVVNHSIRNYEIPLEQAKVLVDVLYDKFSGGIKIHVSSAYDDHRDSVRLITIEFTDESDRAFFELWSNNGIDIF
jgi:hypothetical protein